jgi:hypothetical protein
MHNNDGEVAIIRVKNRKRLGIREGLLSKKTVYYFY